MAKISDLISDMTESAIDQFDYSRDDYEISTKTDERKYKKAKGKYSLLHFGGFLKNKHHKYYLEKLTCALNDFLPPITDTDTVLVVGLGNKYISADSLGVEVIKNITLINCPKICVLAPSVLGLTNIESVDIIDGVVSKIKPKLIIMIDSLCAGDVSRLGTSFQISSTPIVAGSGVNNARKKIRSKTPVISIGVPFVVYASTFLESAITHADLDQNTAKKLLSLPFQELVTLKDIEYAVKSAGFLISDAINNALSRQKTKKRL